MEKDYENKVEDEIYQLDTYSSSTFFTKEEHDNSCHKMGKLHSKETKEFKKGYHLVFMDLQSQIGLRNRDVPVMSNKDAVNKASTSKPKNDTPPKYISKNVT